MVPSPTMGSALKVPNSCKRLQEKPFARVRPCKKMAGRPCVTQTNRNPSPPCDVVYGMPAARDKPSAQVPAYQLPDSHQAFKMPQVVGESRSCCSCWSRRAVASAVEPIAIIGKNIITVKAVLDGRMISRCPPRMIWHCVQCPLLIPCCCCWLPSSSMAPRGLSRSWPSASRP